MAQSLSPTQIIVVDDGSTDDTARIVAELAAENDAIELVRQSENRGAAAARNAGWERAHGEFIAFLDADDEWHPAKLECQVNWMRNNPAVSVTGHAVQLGSSRTLQPFPTQFDAKDLPRWRLLIKNPLATSSVMLSSNVQSRFEPRSRFAEDYDLWLRIAFAERQAMALGPHSLACRHRQADGLSAKMWQMEKGELRAIWRLRIPCSQVATLPLVAASILSLVKFGVRLMRRAVRS
jgi:glycosyltransferase involved in cell wall biosynthesis